MIPLKVEYNNPEFKFRMLVNTNISQLYGEVLSVVAGILMKEISGIIGRVGDYHVNTSIGLNKRLIKTPRQLLTLNKPIVSYNVSVNTEADEGIFAGINFNSADFDTDIIEDMSNVFFYIHDMSDVNKNLKVSTTFKTEELNVEVNVIDDSRQKMLNLYYDWKIIRAMSLPNVIDIRIKHIVAEPLLNEIFRLLNITDKHAIATQNIMRKYSREVMTYEKDTSTGKMEYFFNYITPVTITPTTSNLTQGEVDGGIIKNVILTRPFTVRFNVPSKLYIDTFMSRLSLRELSFDSQKEQLEATVSNNYFKTLDWEKNDKSILFAGIKEQVEEIEEFNIVDVTKDYSLIDYIKWIKDNDGVMDNYVVIRIQNSDETDYTGDKITVDEDFNVTMKETLKFRYMFTIYIYNAPYLEYQKIII